MIEFVSKKIDPIKIEYNVVASFKDEPALVIWEDSKTKTVQHCDLTYLTQSIIYFSGLNKNLDFFKHGLTFKIITLKDHKVIYSYNFVNLSFIEGNKILYISQNNYSGYSYAARNYVYQLLENGFEVQWDINRFAKQTYKPCNIYEKRVFECITKEIDYDSVIIHHVPDIWGNLVNTIPKNKKIYGLTVWETNYLHSDWVNMINLSVDEVIVPSYFNMDVFKNSGIDKKINVWYHDIFPFHKNPNISIDNIFNKLLLYKNGTFIKNADYIKDCVYRNTVYYNISQYNERKNLDQLIFTFAKKFTNKDNVCLVIKTFFKEFNRQQTEMLKYKLSSIINNFKNPPEIIFCFDDLNSDEVNIFHEFGDVYFTLNRGEGFGLCTFTAKKIGNKIICGNFGAEKEFLSPYEDVLLNYELSNVFNMDVYHNWYNEDRQKWAIYDNDYVISKLEYYPKTIKPKYNY